MADLPTLHLGVIDLPYAQTPNAVTKSGRPRKRRRVRSGQQTTGDVAGWLETRYNIMENFTELHGHDIAAALEEGLAGALETILMGGPPAPSLFESAMGPIEEAFRKMLESKELDTLGLPGIPTHASLIGINRRMKRRRTPGRPSFVDTGLYSSSFKAWAD